MRKSVIGVVAIAALGLLAAGCSSSSSPTATTAASSTTTTPVGGATPNDVGRAYVAAVTAGKDTFCATYAAPGEVSTCHTQFLQIGTVTVSSFALGTVTTEGSRAIANFTGKVCERGQCLSESDPNSSMSGGRSFAKAYAIAANPNDPNSSPFAGALVEQHGRWYATGF